MSLFHTCRPKIKLIAVASVQSYLKVLVSISLMACHINLKTSGKSLPNSTKAEEPVLLTDRHFSEILIGSVSLALILACLVGIIACRFQQKKHHLIDISV